ncbi:MAG: hypothetical protein KIT56_01015, partial [Gammaproteobacteria bacterium]|nr:hypothetical protein [Gammaproteobacteria bacterium]
LTRDPLVSCHRGIVLQLVQSSQAAQFSSQLDPLVSSREISDPFEFNWLLPQGDDSRRAIFSTGSPNLYLTTTNRNGK